MYSDEQLNYWGDRFQSVTANMSRAGITFDRFMKMLPEMRERWLSRMSEGQIIQAREERAIPDAGVHNGQLIDPMRHGVRKNKFPWFFNRRHI